MCREITVSAKEAKKEGGNELDKCMKLMKWSEWVRHLHNVKLEKKEEEENELNKWWSRIRKREEEWVIDEWKWKKEKENELDSCIK